MHAGARLHCAEIVVLDGGLPPGAPLGRAGWRQRAFDRAGAGLHLADVTSADEAERAVIEVVTVELVDAHADRAGSDERVEVKLGVVEETVHRRNRLMSEIAPNPSFSGRGIVRLPDA